ncbi:MAG: hypothetical protein IKM59_03990 [Oscillospiraceae bacterium]|nr:hypothetical protein [Oscillospiraceae bacterium]
MLIRILIMLLGLCALGLILCALAETLFCSVSASVSHVIFLQGDAPAVEHTVRKALHTMKGRLYFVDMGLDPEAQMSVELLLRGHSHAMLCAPEQLQQELRWENDLGKGTDQRNSHHGDFPE